MPNLNDIVSLLCKMPIGGLPASITIHPDGSLRIHGAVRVPGHRRTMGYYRVIPPVCVKELDAISSEALLKFIADELRDISVEVALEVSKSGMGEGRCAIQGCSKERVKNRALCSDHITGPSLDWV